MNYGFMSFSLVALIALNQINIAARSSSTVVINNNRNENFGRQAVYFKGQKLCRDQRQQEHKKALPFVLPEIHCNPKNVHLFM